MAIPVRAPQGKYHGRKIYLVNQTFTTDGAVGTGTDIENDPGVTVAKPGTTGVYTVTVPAGRRITVMGLVDVDASGGGNGGWTVTSVVASTGVITLMHTTDGGTPAAADATDDDALHMSIAVDF